jgi:hypothetical protein
VTGADDDAKQDGTVAAVAGSAAHVDAEALNTPGDHRGVRRGEDASSTDRHGGGAHRAVSGSITGRRGDVAHMKASSPLDAAILRTQAKEALVGLGWKPAFAQTAVATALAAASDGLTLERLIFESLRRCAAPKA